MGATVIGTQRRGDLNEREKRREGWRMEDGGRVESKDGQESSKGRAMIKEVNGRTSQGA